MTLSTLISNLKDDIQFLFSAHSARLQLKAVEKGVPVAVKSVYISIVVLLTLIFIPMLLLTGAFALALLFPATLEATMVVRSIALGFCCMDLIVILVLALMVALQNRVTTMIEAKITNGILDRWEEKDRKAAQVESYDDVQEDRPSSTLYDAEDTEVLHVTREE